MEWLHYLPIATTALAALFLRELYIRWRKRGSAHLAWWAFGVFTYGVGTALESTITLFGNSAALTQSWYIAGAVWGGYPLAQGSVWLLLDRHKARILTWITLAYALTLSALVLSSPLLPELVDPRRPSGDVIAWQWVRLWSPLLNGYAAAFLIGGAAVSAVRYFKLRAPGMRERASGNTAIAIGALLPGIGGGMAKAGIVEALYVGELIGLALIWAGYRWCISTDPTEGKGP
ncbi:MAG: hypothetical protein MK209_04690 [Planctomycetes bacterium]|nr:hypothetical protein [Planctomycetota bacterium]